MGGEKIVGGMCRTRWEGCSSVFFLDLGGCWRTDTICLYNLSCGTKFEK